MCSLHVIRSKHADEWRGSGGLLHRGTATSFQSFNQAGHTDNVEAEFPRCFNRLDRRPAGGADIIHNDHARAFFLKAFYPATHTMGFFCFAHQKTMDWSASLRA